MALKVRRCTAFDAVSAAPVISEAFLTRSAPSSFLDRSLEVAKAASRVLTMRGQVEQVVAEDDGEVCGYGELWTTSFLDGHGIRGWKFGQPEAYVSTIAVSRTFRRRGVGTALVSTLEDIARREGLGSISLQVEEANDAAIRLYCDALNYTVTGTDERRMIRGTQFEKRLALRKDLGDPAP